MVWRAVREGAVFGASVGSSPPLRRDVRRRSPHRQDEEAGQERKRDPVVEDTGGGGVPGHPVQAARADDPHAVLPDRVSGALRSDGSHLA
eukprot:scaffold1387_cov260-Pinguiococcus_pyrenoidosus.AAC.2